jgi:hypothetical protein
VHTLRILTTGSYSSCICQPQANHVFQELSSKSIVSSWGSRKEILKYVVACLSKNVLKHSKHSKTAGVAWRDDIERRLTTGCFGAFGETFELLHVTQR